MKNDFLLMMLGVVLGTAMVVAGWFLTHQTPDDTPVCDGNFVCEETQ